MHQSVHEVFGQPDNIGISATINEPLLSSKNAQPNQFALRASAGHLIQPEVGTVAEVQIFESQFNPA